MSEKVYVNICDTKKCPGPVYAVKTGDTLYSIAQRHHCRVRTLLDLNPFVDIYNLQPGEEICVPMVQKEMLKRLDEMLVQMGYEKLHLSEKL